MQLYEKHRPRAWSDVVGQSKAVAKIRRLGSDGFGGLAVWLSGKSGTGKTTIARIIAAEIADDWFVEELDASDLTPARLREIEQSSRLYASGRGGRAYIVNEAHGLRKDTIRQLLVLLERIPGHCCWIFTTTRDGQDSLFDENIDASPLLSRCLAVALTDQGLAQAFAANCRRIATSEGLNGQPIAAYVTLAKKCRNNHRKMLVEVQGGCFS